MYHKHAYNTSDSDDIVPLTVSAAAALTSLPDGKSAAEHIYPSSRSCSLIPDYDTVCPCIDNRSRATVYAKVDVGDGPVADPREILKEVCAGLGSGSAEKIRASLEFQFVLRKLSDGKVHLPRGDGPAQDMVQKLARGLRTHGHSATGLSVRSTDISTDGVVTIALFMSDNLLEAVDNFYRIKRSLQSIASSEGLRASFFYASEDVSGAAFSGTPFDVMCRNRLRCRLHLALASGQRAREFAVGIMEGEDEMHTDPSIYAFAKPNWLTYAARWQFQGRLPQERERMTWGVQHCKTTINFPEGCEVGRLEFGEIDCIANMYLVTAAIAILGRQRTEFRNVLENFYQGMLAHFTKTSAQPLHKSVSSRLALSDRCQRFKP